MLDTQTPKHSYLNLQITQAALDGPHQSHRWVPYYHGTPRDHDSLPSRTRADSLVCQLLVPGSKKHRAPRWTNPLRGCILRWVDTDWRRRAVRTTLPRNPEGSEPVSYCILSCSSRKLQWK